MWYNEQYSEVCDIDGKEDENQTNKLPHICPKEQAAQSFCNQNTSSTSSDFSQLKLFKGTTPAIVRTAFYIGEEQEVMVVNYNQGWVYALHLIW